MAILWVVANIRIAGIPKILIDNGRTFEAITGDVPNERRQEKIGRNLIVFNKMETQSKSTVRRKS